MRKLHEVVFYSGDQPLPAYYIVDKIECESIEEALKSKLTLLTQRVRKMFNIQDNIPNLKIHEALYVLQEDGVIAIRDIT